MSKVIVAPSILSGNFAKMGESVKEVEKWGGDLVHCDIMDGVYVNNITFGMPMVKALRAETNLPLDVHLMITEPEKYVESFCDSGADIVTFHPDATTCPEDTLIKIKNKGKKCGLAFNPNVSIVKYKELFPLCDVVIVMTVYAGKGGQKLIPECLDRIKEVKRYLDEMNIDIPIEADGGICKDNIAEVISSGATIAVAGSSIFLADDPAETIKQFKSVTQ